MSTEKETRWWFDECDLIFREGEVTPREGGSPYLKWFLDGKECQRYGFKDTYATKYEAIIETIERLEEQENWIRKALKACENILREDDE